MTAVATPALVAIGSSADGFRALGTVLKSLPADFPGVVAIVQHRARHDRGYLAQLLRAQTGLEVKDAVDGEPLRRGVVYIAPPDRHLMVEDGHVRLSDAASVNFSRPSVDVLFESVAKVYGKEAIGIVLSGGGIDGAAGLQAIRHSGGRTIVQAPGDAKVTGMPTAALSHDGIDFVLNLEEIGPVVAKLIRVG
jgi:two-component system chemotaxis response regulator CheB